MALLISAASIEFTEPTYRSSRSQMFFKISALENFEKFTEKKKVLQSLFTKVAGLRVKDFIKRRLQYKALSCTI